MSNLKDLENIILKNREVVFKKPEHEPVVYIVSGGLDSTIGVAKVIEEFDCIVYPLFIIRHARATKYEEESFDKITEVYLKRYPKNYMLPKKVDIEIPPIDLKKGLTNERLQKIGHAMRNSALQNVGVQYATFLNDNNNLKIRTIFTGTVGNDFLPHSSLDAFRGQTILVCIDQNDWEWQITSPFVETYLENRPLFKKDNILWAHRLGLPLEHTRTCINDCVKADGICIECKDRLQAFKDADLLDPIEYQNN